MKKIVFLTGTRADYGKIKSLMKKIESSKEFELYIYVCGMHLLEKYGSTHLEIRKDGFKNIYLSNQIKKYTKNDIALSENIKYFSEYIDIIKPDMIFIHGDRIEAMAGAIVGLFNNIYVSHIEGGELSGTLDESIRHSVTKLSHFHFVANDNAKTRVIQLGEREENIFVVGSPDIDIMNSKKLPTLEQVKEKYEIDYEDYSILLFHPVTTELSSLEADVNCLMSALEKSNYNYIVIYPNNDPGTEIILNRYKKTSSNHFKFFPSIRFEYFLSLLKNSHFVIGNSSAGIRECGFYGIPSINIGTRQNGRANLKLQKNIQNIDFSDNEIMNAIIKINNFKNKDTYYGSGNSDEQIYQVLINNKIWDSSIQKQFRDL